MGKKKKGVDDFAWEVGAAISINVLFRRSRSRR